MISCGFKFFTLAYFTQHDYLKVHPCCVRWFKEKCWVCNSLSNKWLRKKIMKIVAEWIRSTPLSHSTSPGLLVTQQYSRIIISSPNLSQASVPPIWFFLCLVLLDFSQAPHTQKYRSRFLIFFPTLLPLQHWLSLFGSLPWCKIPLSSQSANLDISDLPLYAHQNRE